VPRSALKKAQWGIGGKIYGRCLVKEKKKERGPSEGQQEKRGKILGGGMPCRGRNLKTTGGPSGHRPGAWRYESTCKKKTLLDRESLYLQRKIRKIRKKMHAVLATGLCLKK